MSTETARVKGTIRKLWPTEIPAYRDHLLRLDADSRRLRFGMTASDDFISDYASRISHMKSIVFGYFVDGVIRAAAELRPLDGPLPHEAEAAFSVERPYQDSGIGTELMGRVIRAARNRNIHRIYMNCLAENRKMQRVAKKYDAVLQFEEGDVVGELAPATPNCFSIWREALEDEHGFVMAVLDLQRHFMPAA
ncbi:MAG: GNAT family N-acetyltransferase [Alphaproteobacteria bacterium]|nr:MAG: GNAT family N-acetyltransferase [Alphaproteobacteria bacterium]